MSTYKPIKIAGIAETEKVFLALPPKVQKRVMPKATRAGGQVLTKAARVNAPKNNRLLSRSLTMLIRRYKGSVYAVIGQQNNKTFKAGKKKKKRGGISGRGLVVPLHLVEENVKPHKIPGASVLKYERNGQTYFATGVNHPGRRGSHFIRKAAASHSQAALREFEAKFTSEFDRETRPIAEVPVTRAI